LGGVSPSALDKPQPIIKGEYMKELEKDDDTVFNDIEDMFKEFEEEDLKWKEKHPFRAHIRDWLDKRFPNGIAGGYRVYYANIWKILRYYKDEVKYANQRVFRGWDDKAAWHVGYYLSETLPGIIRQLKKVKHGFPVRMYEGAEDFPISEMELGSIDKDGNYVETEEEKIAAEKWDKILDEIAEGFECYLKFDEEFDYKIPREEDENYKKFQHALDLLKEHYEDLWD
jgi:hypothetical protein